MKQYYIDRRTVLGVGGTALAASLAGCTGDGGGTPTDTFESGDDGTPTPTSMPEADATVTVGPGGDLVFEPAELSVDLGATVAWTWDSDGHSATPNDIPDDSDWQGTGTTLHDAGFSHAHTFEIEGRYSYYCDPHRGAGMNGTLVVGDAPTPTGSGGDGGTPTSTEGDGGGGNGGTPTSTEGDGGGGGPY